MNIHKFHIYLSFYIFHMNKFCTHQNDNQLSQNYDFFTPNTPLWGPTVKSSSKSYNNILFLLGRMYLLFSIVSFFLWFLCWSPITTVDR